MLRMLVAGPALALLTGAVAAADLGEPPPPQMFSPTPIAFNWSGFYIGAHAGYGFGDGDGFVAGGQLGANWQRDSFLFGLEADGSFVDWHDTHAVGTARVRGGVAFDRFLAYATGGVAFGDDVGWVAGAGLEYALTNNWTVGAEYLHYGLDDDSDVVRARLNYLFGGLSQ